MGSVNTENLLPLYFAAPVSWYAMLISRPALIIGDERKFERQTLRNRLNYGTFQGTKMFSIPLVNESLRGSYQEVAINYKQNWKSQLINALQTAYGKSPFFEFYGYRFEKIINNNWEFLWDLNNTILNETLNCLKIDKALEFLKIDKIDNLPDNVNCRYYQVFQERNDFLPNLSILDLLYNEGPDSYEILLKMNLIEYHE